jgi:hypothetical protein
VCVCVCMYVNIIEDDMKNNVFPFDKGIKFPRREIFRWCFPSDFP